HATRPLAVPTPPRYVPRAATPQHDGELVTRKARAQITLADRRAQHIADRAQRPIAHLVPVGVVELLEAIEIEHDDADGGLGLRRARQSLLEPLIERAAIRQPRQRIGVR